VPFIVRRGGGQSGEMWPLKSSVLGSPSGSETAKGKVIGHRF
jgi:hypothetical protein